MIIEHPDAHGVLPDQLNAHLRRAVRLTVGDLDALATIEARRRTSEGWTDWQPVTGLLEGDGTIWCGTGSVVQLRASGHTALTIEDDLAPADLPRKATVAAALSWLGLDADGTRAQLNARLEAAP